jgi:hypothetical protein
MTMYVFSTTGQPVGFVFESFIFDLEGSAVGRIMGPRVYRMDGTYAGEWLYNMVVDRGPVRARPIRPIEPPDRRPPMPPCAPRRPVAEYNNYADAFAGLYDNALEETPSE